MTSPEEPSENPFSGVPFFGDLMRMLGQQGSSWDAASQFAVSIASGGTSEPNVDPAARIELADLARIAAMHVGDVTGLVIGDVEVTAVNRTAWAHTAVNNYRPLFEDLTAALGRPATDDVSAEELASDPMAAMFGNLMLMMAPLMMGMTAGSMVGHLAQRALGTYHLPLPRPAGSALQLVAPNIDGFADEWSLDRRDLRLWVCLSELTHHAVLCVPHIDTALRTHLTAYVKGFRADPDALEDTLGAIDPTALSSLDDLRKLLGDPAVLLGAIRSPQQEAMLPRLDALVAVVLGYVDHAMDLLTGRLLGSSGRLTEALRRRRVEASDADRFVERLLGLELTEHAYDRGAAFVRGVVERAGGEGLAKLWDSERALPTPAEIDAPGLWLARLEFD